MKIQAYGFTEEDIKNGFNSSTFYEVNRISILGDYCAYDLFYKIRNEQGKESWIFDLSCEIIEQEKEIEKLLEGIEKLWKENSNLDIPYKFNYEINVEDYISFKLK
jgi:hypothetical protein